VDKYVDNRRFPVQKQAVSADPKGIRSFYDKKDYPISYPFKSPFSNGLFHFSGILRILKEIEDPSMI